MSKFTRFFKRQGYYILLGVCVLMVATIITLSVVLSDNLTDTPAVGVPDSGNGDDTITPTPDPNDEPDTDTSTPEPDTDTGFLLPVSSNYTVFNGATLSSNGAFGYMCYGLMFDVELGDSVIASGNGKVMSNDIANKTLTVLYSDQNIVITYKGLDYTNGTAKDLTSGQAISQNQVLGTATANYNYNADKLSAVHIEIYDASTYGDSFDRVTDYNTIFNIEDK